MLSTTQRPIPLRMRPDLVASRIAYRDEGTWVIKDPVGLKYHRLLDEQHFILHSLDGQQSLEQIRDRLIEQFPTLHLELSQVQSVVTDLYEKGLLISERPGRAGALRQRHRDERRKKLVGVLSSILYLRIPGWDPERTLTWLYRYVRWMFHPVAVAACLALIVASWILLGIRFEHFHATFPEFEQFFGWPNLLYLWLTLAGAKILHEFGHGLSCKHFGGECHEMGVMLLVFSPTLYCDVTDSWMLRSKWQRIAIASAGIYVELIISGFALFLWSFTDSGLLHLLCFNVFTLTTITTVIFNANPLMRFDGYYIFADWVEIPNLRAKASKMLRDTFGWYCLGIRPQPDPFVPDSGSRWLALYAIASAIYRWFILFSITLFLYTFLKPYGLQSIGVTLAVVSLAGILGTIVYGIFRTFKTPRNEPMSYPKIAISSAVLVALVVAASAIPFSWHVEAAFLVEPENGHDVKVSMPGRLLELHVRPGDTVRKEDLLAVLEDPVLADRYRELETERAVLLKRIQTHEALNDSAGESLVESQIKKVDTQLQHLREQMQQLRIIAPCDGVVVAPPQTQQTPTQPGQPLPRWHGTPLERRNLGCYLERGTHLLTVAPTERLVAVAMVDQSHRNELAVGQDVELKFDHLPNATVSSSVTAVSRRPQQFAPPALSNKYGGELPTTTDAQGREKLFSVAYPATVPLGGDPGLYRTGMRGRARFLMQRRSAADWAWRYLRQTFQFRL